MGEVLSYRLAYMLYCTCCSGVDMKKKPSDSTLNAAWRRAVLESYHGRCGICGLSWIQGALECHHIIKRRRKLTRWNWKNGIPLCQQCHQLAHTKVGERIISQRHPWYDELVILEQIDFKQYLSKMEWTENQWRRRVLEELKEKAGKDVEV